MTSLAAISDASTIADGWRGWAFVAAVIVIGGMVAVIVAITARPHNVPVMGDELSRLDRLDRPRCASSGPRGGHYYRTNDGAWLCQRCGDRVEMGA